MLILRAARYIRQAHNLKVADSNPTPSTNQGADNNKIVKKVLAS